MTAVTKGNVVNAQRDHLMFDAIKLAVALTHFCKPEAFERVRIRECFLLDVT